MTTPQDILHFWFTESSPAQWFQTDPQFDATIRARFGDFTATEIAQFQQTQTHPWQNEANSALALVLLADQFPRNIYRDTPQAFAWCDLSLTLARAMIADKHDINIADERRIFAYLPFMHSENLDDQQYCIDLIKTRLDSEDALHHAHEHYALIEKFGRFPHRNAVIGRESTQAEVDFLDNGGYRP